MRRVRLMLAAVLATGIVASTVAVPNDAAPAEAAASDVIAIVIEGTGNGHGRGMSQWGAYGWAVDHGWGWEQILDWYYGGTAMGDADVNSRMTVRLQGLDGAASVGVVSYAGGVSWNGQTFTSMRAVKNLSGAYFDVYGSGTATCDAADVYVGSNSVVSFTTATGEVPGSNPLAATGLCRPDGSVVQYRGSIDVSIPDGTRVVNNVRTEDYLRGVVPREVAASWADAGRGAGANAVRAQSVAARSYALAQNRYAYAKTCDSTACQAYGGAAERPNVGGTPTLREDFRSDQAVAATAGKIRVAGGAIVSTEFSASNGPRTAGGSFPVRDDAGGDGTTKNPNHRWVRILDADALAATYGLGSITAAQMVEAADPAYQIYDGIWFDDLVLTGSNGTTFRQQAWDFRGANGLPSPGFTVRVLTRDSTNATMAFIGDSIGVGVAGTDAAPLRIVTNGTFASSSFDSMVDRRTHFATADASSGVQVARSLPLNLDLVLVELGYTDAPSGFARDIDAMMATLTARGAKRVVWVNMAEFRPGPRRSSFYARSNAALNAARTRWPNLDVAPWNQASAASEHVRWFGRDGTHLTTTGNAQFSLWLRDHLACGS